MRFLTIVILVSVVLAGCADRIVTDSDYEVPRFDRPSVEHISPRNTSVNVPADAPVSIWFDMLMDEESVRSLVEIWRDVRAVNILALTGSEDLVFASGEGSGIFRSIDGGGSWDWRSEGMSGFSAADLVMTSGGLLAVAEGTVWRSSDEGATFSVSDSGLPSDDARSLAVAPGDPSVVYLTTDANGVFRSSDGGSTWQARSDGLRLGRPVVDAAVHPTNPDIVAVTTDVDFVYMTDDGGSSWVRTRDGLTDRHLVDVAFAVSDPDVLYVISDGGQVFRSSDGGASWLAAEDGTTGEAGFAIAVSEGDANHVVAASSEGVHFSLDGGQSWREIPMSTHGGDSVEISYITEAMVLADGTVYVGADVGILRGNTTALFLEDHVERENLLVEGTMKFEVWQDTTMMVELRDHHDPLSADTTFINPYINERALAAWFANGKKGDPPVEAYPDATRMTFTPDRPLPRGASFRVRVPGTFEEDLHRLTGSRGVEDVHGNSKETHFDASFSTEP